MRKNLEGNRLTLHRETLARLDGPWLRAIRGGDTTTYANCPPTRQPSLCRACEEPPPREP
jgi:hypothetical protein